MFLNLKPQNRRHPLSLKWKKKKRKEKKKKVFSALRSIDGLLHTFYHYLSLVISSSYNSAFFFNNFSSFSNGFTLFLIGLICKDLSVNSFKVQVCKVSYMAMVLHHPTTKKLEALEILLELHIREAIRLQEPGNHLLTQLVHSQECNLDFLVFLNDELFLDFQGFLQLFHLLFGLG